MTPGAAGDPVRAFLQESIDAGRFPGAVWRIERSTAIVSEGAVGLACVEPSPVPAASDTPYDLASLTKPLATAWIALALEAEGRLDLQAPAGSLCEELRGSPYETADVVALGAHRAGLPAWKPLYLEANDLAGFLGAIARTPPVVAPGDTLYSDLGYIVLAAALERAGGAALDVLFDTHVARPLGLARIGFAVDPVRFADAAATERGNAYERSLAGAAGASHAWRTGVLRGEVHDGNCRALGGVAGHAGLFGGAADVAAIGRAILADTARRERLLRPVAGPGSRTFGMCPASLSNAARGVLPADAPGHTGFTGTSLWLVPEEDLVLVLLTNRVHPVVIPEDFQPVRLEFHRRGLELARRR